MKNYNKILEAVNRGIQLALDDFDDDEQVQNIKSKQVQNRDYTKEYLDLLKYEVVDLGLPSKSLWYKYNLGVDPNQLINPEDWYGSYYAWGELEPNKKEYNWDNYKFIHTNDLLKYNKKDNLTELLPEDDAAYQNKKFYNYKFHIPSKEQCEELINYTNNYWINNYDPNKINHTIDDGGIQGLNGRVFEGKNGNTLFIPAAGYHSGLDTNSVGSSCYLWSSSLHLDIPQSSYYLYFNSEYINMIDFHRYYGHSVHPVVNL